MKIGTLNSTKKSKYSETQIVKRLKRMKATVPQRVSAGL